MHNIIFASNKDRGMFFFEEIQKRYSIYELKSIRKSYTNQRLELNDGTIFDVVVVDEDHLLQAKGRDCNKVYVDKLIDIDIVKNAILPCIRNYNPDDYIEYF